MPHLPASRIHLNASFTDRLAMLIVFHAAQNYVSFGDGGNDGSSSSDTSDSSAGSTDPPMGNPVVSAVPRKPSLKKRKGLRVHDLMGRRKTEAEMQAEIAQMDVANGEQIHFVYISEWTGARTGLSYELMGKHWKEAKMLAESAQIVSKLILV
eukprot:1157556-Pelagomonas_calceolata.AAC.11